MRNILLSSVAVVALLVAGLGGTFATWSDSEVSANNTIVTGSLDLKVNGADDEPWGTGVPKVIDIECMVPDKWYLGGIFHLWNAGQCTETAKAYFHLKDYICTNVAPKEVWVDPPGVWVTTGYYDSEVVPEDYGPHAPWPPESMYKPEPELVAEYGGPGPLLGKVDCTWVGGLGEAEGDECSMGTNLFMAVTLVDVSPENENFYVANPDLIVATIQELDKWYCKEITLFDLPPCNEKQVWVWFFLNQKSEDEIPGIPDYFPDVDPAVDPVGAWEYEVFNDWPSWSLMKDKATLVIEFDLVLEELNDL
jgi:predicted ribosomally synthesized peptide with SipW-like signal peptide